MMESSQTERILMAQKLAGLKAQLQEDFKFSYELILKPDAPYDTKKQQLDELLKTQYTLGDLDKLDDIILGKIEGMSTQVNAKTFLKQKFGIQNQPILDEYLKNKIDTKNYGLKKKDKGKQIYEIKNQKSLETLYNIKDIKNARKLRSLYKNMVKAISKFVQLYEKKADKLFSFYSKAVEQQRKFLEFKAKTEISVIEIDVPIQPDAPVQSNVPAQVTQIIPEIPQNVEQVPQENVAKSEKSDNEEIKTSLGSGEKSKKQKKKQKKQEKEKKPKNKKEKQQNQVRVDVQSDASSFSVPPKKKQQPKLENFFKLTPKKIISPTEIINEEPDHENSISCANALKFEKQQQPAKSKEQLKDMQQNSFINKLLSQEQDFKLSDLRNQITMKSMDQEKPISDKYVNIVFWDSMLQYQNYPAPSCYFMQFTQPFKYQQQVRYLEDSADIYEDLIGQNLEENNDNQMEQQEEGEYSGNNTIVPDDYFSEVEISSQGQQMKGLKTFKLLDGRQQLWSFSKTDLTQKVQQYKMVFLCQEFMPLQLNESNLQNQNIPLSMKIALLKQIHGYYKPRQNLLKQLGLITDKLSKNGLNNFIKQNSSKVGNQRLIKQEIIDEIKQAKQDIDKEFEEAKKVKDNELQQTQQIKNNEKQLKLQKAILEYEGSKYILNLVKHLKEKEFKISKKQLDEFISSRTGEVWEEIKKDFKKIKRKQGKDKQKELKQKEEKQKEPKSVNEPNQQNFSQQPQMIKMPQKNFTVMKPLQTIFKQIEVQYENDPEKLNQIKRKKEAKLQLEQQQQLMKEKMKQQIQQKQVNYGDDPEDPDYDEPSKKKKKSKKSKKEDENKMDVENMCQENEDQANKPQMENQDNKNENNQLPARRRRKKVNYRKFIEDD